MNRRCARPQCGLAASATLSYAYDLGLAVIEDLATEDHPMTHDLCPAHADTLAVPRGWERRDDRSAVSTSAEAHHLLSA